MQPINSKKSKVFKLIVGQFMHYLVQMNLFYSVDYGMGVYKFMLKQGINIKIINK